LTGESSKRVRIKMPDYDTKQQGYRMRLKGC
jgi:hypothetical protein